MKDLVIPKTLEFLFAEVQSVVTLITQPLDNAYRHAHVSEKPHQLGCDDFLLNKPGHVFERLPDVAGFLIGIFPKNFVHRRTVRDLTDDH
jgi:hypothetical protein